MFSNGSVRYFCVVVIKGLKKAAPRRVDCGSQSESARWGRDDSRRVGRLVTRHLKSGNREVGAGAQLTSSFPLSLESQAMGRCYSIQHGGTMM